MLADEFDRGHRQPRRRGAPDDRASPTLVDQRHIVDLLRHRRRRQDHDRGDRSRSKARGAGATRVVVTIDPAKRLANALGLEHALQRAARDPARRLGSRPATPRRVGAARADARHEDHVRPARRDATRVDEEQAQRILENRFYRNIAGALSGTQEYMAMEKLLRAPRRRRLRPHRRRHAADPSRARLPRRAARGSRACSTTAIFRVLMVPTRTTLRVGDAWRCRRSSARSRASSAPSRRRRRRRRSSARSRGWKQGFRDRAAAGHAAPRRRRDRASCSSRRRGATRSKRREYFAERLADGELAVDALVVNRVHGQYSGAERRTGCATRGARARRGNRRRRRDAARAARYENLADFDEVAGRERRELAGLEERIGDASVAHVPELGHDVHDFAALRAVGDHLLAAG